MEDSVPGPKTIQSMLREQLAALEITSACIVDDAFSPGIDVEQWLHLIETARSDDPELFHRVEDLIAAEKGNVEQPPGEHVLLSVRRLAGQSQASTVRQLLRDAPAEPALESLTVCLQELGLNVKKYWNVDEAPRDEPLYFVDYRLQPETQDTYGRDASRLIAEALRSTGPLGRAPGAVLMSRSEDQAGHPNSADQEAVSRDGGGFVRCNFRYIDKTFLTDKQRLRFLLYDLLGSIPVGRDYYQQVRALQDVAAKAMANVAGEMCSLLPVDFRVFAARFAGQPQSNDSASEHLLAIFTGLLVTELRNNTDIQTTVKAFHDLLQRPGMMAPSGVESHSLHRIHSKLIYDQSKSTMEGSLAFGDIFACLRQPGTYLLVLTPECDLEPRSLDGGERGPKVDLVLVLSGNPGPPPSLKDATIVSTPLFLDDQHGEAQWIRWDLRRPQYVPWRRLMQAPKRFKKWARLRNAEAEQIQLRVANDLLAVGTDDISTGIQIRQAVLWEVTEKKHITRLADLAVYEIAPHDVDDKPRWALPPGYEHEFCRDQSPILAAETMGKLREYTSKLGFVSLLNQSHVRVFEEGSTIHLGWFPSSQYRPQKWSGPTNQTAAADPSENHGGAV